MSEKLPFKVWVGHYPDDGYTGESFDADIFDDGNNRESYTNTAELIEKLEAMRKYKDMHDYENHARLAKKRGFNASIDAVIKILEDKSDGT